MVFWRWRNKVVNRERILALDLLRGLFLIIITTSHIYWAPSLYTLIGGGGALPASAAEGFFAISGILVGYLYGPRILNSTKKITLKLWKRAAFLYILAVFFTFLYTVWALLEPGSSMYHSVYNRGDFFRFIFDTLTLQYAFGFADFLARYAVFMLFAPLAVWLIAKRKTWVVALTSFTIWLTFHNANNFPFLAAWQIVFMYGIILGYYLPHIESWFKQLSKEARRAAFVAVTLVALTSYVASVIIFILGPAESLDLDSLLAIKYQLDPFFDKNHLPLARLLIGVVWLAALYLLFRRYEKQLSKYSLGILETLGRQSLFVYSIHSIVLFCIAVYFYPPPEASFIQNTFVTTVTIFIIYLAAYYRGHITKIGKKLLSKRDTTQVP